MLNGERGWIMNWGRPGSPHIELEPIITCPTLTGFLLTVFTAMVRSGVVVRFLTGEAALVAASSSVSFYLFYLHLFSVLD